jgi:segregation and condensation protein A
MMLSNAETPLAVVQGVPLVEFPKDLYIPPDALRVFLETFEGPLDLLLYLIQKQNLDILNIPVAQITQQYLHYISLMQELQLDLVSEYLSMASLLLEIKSRLLLPQPDKKPENDPRRQLVQQLEEYANIKRAAEILNDFPMLGRDVFLTEVFVPEVARPKIPPNIKLNDLLEAMQDVLLRIELFTAHQISREPLSVRERMTFILELFKSEIVIDFYGCFKSEESRAGVVVAFLAILELAKESLLNINQHSAFAPISIFVENTHDIT